MKRRKLHKESKIIEDASFIIFISRCSHMRNKLRIKWNKEKEKFFEN
jgi:hypothetical protein